MAKTMCMVIDIIYIKNTKEPLMTLLLVEQRHQSGLKLHTVLSLLSVHIFGINAD